MIMNNNLKFEKMKEYKKLQDSAFSVLREIYPDCNPLAPGFLKEVTIANILGHRVETEKHLPDGYDMEGYAMEYICVLENVINPKTGKKKYRNFAMDGMFSSPPKAKEGSLKRITRNKDIYYAFLREGGLEIYELWRGIPKDLENLVDAQLTRRDRLDKNEHTVGISKTWVRENCKKII